MAETFRSPFFFLPNIACKLNLINERSLPEVRLIKCTSPREQIPLNTTLLLQAPVVATVIIGREKMHIPN